MRFKAHIESTPTSYSVNVSHNISPEELVDEGFVGYDAKNGMRMSRLEPGKFYLLDYYMDIKDGERLIQNITVPTRNLSINTLQPKVISPGNVIVAAETNLDDEEENVGFEWRRTDWTDDFSSNSGVAYLYEGVMEGYIRNLYTEKLWKFRPYYESATGNRYYGDWMGLDPTNTSYFEPTVHTYAMVSVDGNSAEVRGYAMRGSDNVTAQGFKYWKTVAGTRATGVKATDIPRDAETIEASGQVMTTVLTGLDYESQYSYVAFMTTSEGETFYGELKTFTTGIDVTGIENVHTTEQSVTEVARYDIRGCKLQSPQRGLNIVHYNNGTTRKVVVK